MDPAHPAERLAYLLADSRTSLIITTSDIGDDLPAGRTPTLTLDDRFTPALLSLHPTTPPDLTHHPLQAAYLIYTSGSTGQPKAVTITHHNLINYLTVTPPRLSIGQPEASYALLQNTVTDFANTILFTSLTTGGTLHIPPADTATDPQHLAAYLAEHPIDHYKIVPSHLAALTHATNPAALLPRLTLTLGGEAIAPADLHKLHQHTTGQIINNHYGPTETTIGTLTTPLAATSSPQPAPLGTPIPNTTAHILSPHLDPQPPGIPGELHISGPGLARGYHNRPALTAERFIAAPNGERLYRTGDRAHHHPNGPIHFHGRTDHQIKLRGYRIEPAEIQHTLTTHQAITTALITLHHDRLIAYLVPSDHEQGIPPAPELRDYLRGSLPEHMIPAVFIELAEFPRTPNGKIDRRALPDPDTAHHDNADAYQPPLTPTHHLLADIWQDLLNVEQVGITDNFFDLGGHSLLATQAISRIRTTTGHEVGLGDLFDHPTIAELSDLLVATSGSEVLPDHRSMVRIRWGSVSPAIFAVHSVTGAASDFTGLARNLAPEQQWFALQARGLDGAETPSESVEEMAAAYLDEVLAVQQEGPYLFAAWSMGGYVAVEMARQAEARGLEVGGVFLIGPPLHRLRRGIDKARDTRQLRGLMRRLDDVIAAEPGTRLSQSDEELLLELWAVKGDLLTDLRAGEKQALRVARVVAANSLAVLHHRARRGVKPYTGRVVLLVPEDDPKELQTGLLDQWRSSLAGTPEVQYVPGTHEAIIREEGAAHAGARLSEEITRLQRGTPNETAVREPRVGDK